jgi:hypothetical protein
VSQATEQIVRDLYQLAEVKDLDGFVAAFTPDGTFTDNSIEVTYTGQGIADTVANYATAFPDMHRELFRFYSTDNYVFVQLALQGTHKGPLKMPEGSIPATGKRMDAPCSDVFELVGDKVKRFDCYPMGSVVLTQLGVIGNLAAALQH